MQNENQVSAPLSPPLVPAKGLNRHARNILFALQFLLVGAFLVVWYTSGDIKKSTSLFVLFLYSIPSEFLISFLPHEPILIYFGSFFSPLTVAWVALAGTLLAEVSNYYAIGHILDFRAMQKYQEGATTRKVVALFNRMPFVALWIAGFTPIPFYPFRFFVVLARYPLWKYVLAVATSRGPRFYLLALAGKLMKIPGFMLILFAAAIVLMANFQFIWKFLRKILRRKPASP
jgi:membrane protein YqaA with SNARE-associated domain